MKVQHIASGKLANVQRWRLLSWHEEYQQMMGSGLGNLLRKKIEDFYKGNGVRVQAIIDMQNQIIRDHYELNADGTVKSAPVMDGENPVLDKEGKPALSGVLKQGKTDLMFNEEMNKKMAEVVPYELT